MALEHRYYRRSHGEAVLGALRRGATEDRFFRAMLSRKSTTGFFVLTLKMIARVFRSYDDYRKARTAYLQLYARGLLEQHPHLKRIVGIAREPFSQDGGVSEDMVYAEQCEWTDEERREIRRDCEKASVLTNSMTKKAWSGKEYPSLERIAFQPRELDTAHSTMNRKQRRAQAARQRGAQGKHRK